MAHRLNQTEKDLQQFAYRKVHTTMKDVVQSFTIAGFHGADALVCLGAIFLKIATQIAVTINVPKHEYLKRCSNLFDQLTEDERNA